MSWEVVQKSDIFNIAPAYSWLSGLCQPIQTILKLDWQSSKDFDSRLVTIDRTYVTFDRHWKFFKLSELKFIGLPADVIKSWRVKTNQMY